MARNSHRATIESLPNDHDLKCGERVGLRKATTTERAGRWTDVSPPVADLRAVREGDRIGLSVRDAEHLGLDRTGGDTSDRGGGLLIDVTRIREGLDDAAPSDLWGETPSGAWVHVYPRRGKVERVDDGRDAADHNVTSLVNTAAHVETPGWTRDGSPCGASARWVVEVGGVEVAACHHHQGAAAERAAAIAGVDLDDHDPAVTPGDDPDPATRPVNGDKSVFVKRGGTRPIPRAGTVDLAPAAAGSRIARVHRPKGVKLQANRGRVADVVATFYTRTGAAQACTDFLYWGYAVRIAEGDRTGLFYARASRPRDGIEAVGYTTPGGDD
jgi:hypothetical protein